MERILTEREKGGSTMANARKRVVRGLPPELRKKSKRKYKPVQIPEEELEPKGRPGSGPNTGPGTAPNTGPGTGPNTGPGTMLG